MSRPGDRLRALAARVFDARTMERVIDPVVADLQAESGAAVRASRSWKSRAIRIDGYLALLKVIAVCGWREAFHAPGGWPTDDRRSLVRVSMFSALAVATLTILLEVQPLLSLTAHPHSAEARLLLYLLPQALPLAVPVGTTLGILFGLRGRRLSRRMTGTIVALTLICSVGSFVNLAWIVPAGNQAFRVAASGDAAVLPGAPELSLGELSRQIELSKSGAGAAWLGDVRQLAFHYHLRWAFSFSPFALVLLAFSVLGAGGSGRLVLGAAACGAFLSYYVILYGGRSLVLDGAVPAFAAAWLPNVLLALVAGATKVIRVRPAPSP